MDDALLNSLHPVARRWLTTGTPLQELVDEALPAAHGADRALLESVRELRLNAGNPEAWPHLLIHAADVDLSGHAPELVLLFLMCWARVARQAGRRDVLRRLRQRAVAAWDDRLPPALQHCAADIAAMEADLAGDLPAQESAARLVATLLRHTPRYVLALLDVLELLARQGRSAEIRSEIQAATAELPLGPHRTHVEGWVAFGELQDALERADDRAALECLHTVEAMPGIEAAYPERLAAARRLIEVIARARGGAAKPAGVLPAAPAWVQVIELLLDRQTADAYILAQEAAIDDPGSSIGNAGLAAFTFLRAALASRNAAAAALVLRRREARHSPPHLVALFRARLHWLLKEPEAAARCWREARRAAEARGHLARLHFELRLACELSPFDLIELGTLAASLPDADGETPPRPEDLAPPAIVGVSPAVRRVRELVAQYALLPASVLITGATGTGKELVARALHLAGPRRQEPFEAVNCGAISETLLESELFGHEPGAFTGAVGRHPGMLERAAGGTLFLDEVADTPARIQAALLRVLETRDYRPVGGTVSRLARCRIVTATNRDLEREVRSGRFREDLWFRLQRLEIVLPALADRPEDILPLAYHFLAAGRPDHAAPEFSPTLERVLQRHRWRGNVRELQTVVEQMRLYNADALYYDIDAWNAAKRFQSERRAARSGDEPLTPVLGHTPAGGGTTASTPVSRRPTGERRADLDRLFRRHGKLRRKDVVRLLRISPATATADLNALLQSGVIKVVNPTDSPRTRYFALVT